MADHSYNRTAIRGSVNAAALLAVGVVLFYAWNLAPVAHQGRIWNACGAAARIYLLWALIRATHAGPAAVAVAVWWTAEDLMVAGCKLAGIWWTWYVPPGQAECSALLGFDLGAVGILVAAALLGFVTCQK